MSANDLERGAKGLFGMVPSGPMLVADIGGTNARWGWLAHANAAVSHVQTVQVTAFSGPAQAARHYLAHIEATLGADYRPPRFAAIAVATAVLGDEVHWTNSAWTLSRNALQQALGLERLDVLNDFEALALSLPHLKSEQLSWRGLAPSRHAPGRMLAVVGPGTGLGVAAVKHSSSLGWIALPGEGGHATLAGQTDLELAVLACIRRHFAHVSAERVLSGAGLALLNDAVCTVQGRAPDGLAPEQVLSSALQDASNAHSTTLDLFCGLLGSFAGNVALTCGARGGVFIGGGMVPRMGQRFFESSFRTQFEAKGRFGTYLADVPTPVITDTLAALTGAAEVASAA